MKNSATWRRRVCRPAMVQIAVCALGAFAVVFAGFAPSPALAQKRAKAATSVKLTQTALDDGTGSIGLAPGWRITENYRGSVTCVGPNGAAVILKMPWVILRPESSVAGLPGAAQSPVARAGDIGNGLREVLQKKVSAQLTSVRGKRLADVAPGAPAYMLLYEYKRDGVTLSGMGYFASLDYGPSQPFWQLYCSVIVAPKADFARLAPVMLAMWKSWRPNGQTPAEGSSSKMIDDILDDRKLRYDMIQEKFREQL